MLLTRDLYHAPVCLVRDGRVGVFEVASRRGSRALGETGGAVVSLVAVAPVAKCYVDRLNPLSGFRWSIGLYLHPCGCRALVGALIACAALAPSL